MHSEIAPEEYVNFEISYRELHFEIINFQYEGFSSLNYTE